MKTLRRLEQTVGMRLLRNPERIKAHPAIRFLCILGYFAEKLPTHLAIIEVEVEV